MPLPSFSARSINIKSGPHGPTAANVSRMLEAMPTTSNEGSLRSMAATISQRIG